MQYKGIIFDLDGVLCHTDEFHYQAWKELAEKMSVSFDRKKNNRLRGVSRIESLHIVLEDFSGLLEDHEWIALAEEKNANYQKFLSSMLPSDIAPEVRSTLEKIKNKGFRLGIGSSSKNAEYILEKTDMTHYFDCIASGNDIQNSKPDPEVFLLAAKKLGLPASSCLVVEDAIVGVQAAKAGGMDCAAIGDASKAKTATYNLQNLSDLIPILGLKI